MKRQSCRIVTIFALLVIPIHIYADGVFKYDTDYFEDIKTWCCSMIPSVEYLNNINNDPFASFDTYITKSDGYASFRFLFYNSLFDSRITKILAKCDANPQKKLVTTVVIELSNGEQFSIPKSSVFSRDDIFAEIFSFFIVAKSNRKIINDERRCQAYFATQLSKYDIKSIRLCGETFCPKFKTAPTFKSMFNTLATKSGYTNAFTYNSSGRSSSSSGTTSTYGKASSSGSSSRSSYVQVDDIMYFLLDERGISSVRPDDFNIYDNVMLTIKNSRGKKVWIETKFYDATTSRGITATNSQYRVSGGTAGCIKSFVLDTDDYCKGVYTVTPLSALGLGNGIHKLEVWTWIYVGTKDDDSAILAPIKTLVFTKYSNSVSKLIVNDK